MNGESMNSYMVLVNDRDRAVRRARAAGCSALDGLPLSPSNRRTFCFDIFFLGRLWTSRIRYNEHLCQKRVHKAGHRLVDVDIVIVPIDLRSVHWVLVVVDIERQHFSFCDSFLSGDVIDAVGTVQRW